MLAETMMPSLMGKKETVPQIEGYSFPPWIRAIAEGREIRSIQIKMITSHSLYVVCCFRVINPLQKLALLDILPARKL